MCEFAYFGLAGEHMPRADPTVECSSPPCSTTHSVCISPLRISWPIELAQNALRSPSLLHTPKHKACTHVECCGCWLNLSLFEGVAIGHLCGVCGTCHQHHTHMTRRTELLQTCDLLVQSYLQNTYMLF